MHWILKLKDFLKLSALRGAFYFAERVMQMSKMHLLYEEAKTQQHNRKWGRILGIATLVILVLIGISIAFDLYKDVILYREQQATLAELDQVVAEMQIKLETMKEEY